MPRMKREEWYNIARDVDWTRSYVDEEAVFPEWLSGSGKVPREAWQSWDEPYKCAYPDYVATQREKEGSVYAVKAALQRSNIFESLDEGWKSTAKAHFGVASLSEYLAVLHNIVRGTPPWIDLAVEKNVQRVCRDAIRDGLVRSAHDVSEGGLAVALAECCITAPGSGFGAEIEMEGALRADAWLFGESQSRVILSVRRRHLSRLRELADALQVPFTILGEVRARRLRIGELIDVDVADLRATWTKALPRRMANAGGDDARQVS